MGVGAVIIDQRKRIIGNARDHFLSDGRLDASLRAEIASSWRRSRLSGVDPNKADVPFVPLLDGGNRWLLSAATPVIDWLAGQLPSGSAVILADPEARILDRRASGAQYSRFLDEVLCVPGSVYSEEHIGTNGIGSVIETMAPVAIAGAEHYRDNFQDFTCVGTPLRHPLNQRLTGVLNVSCRYQNSHDMMVALMSSAAREIESRMYTDSSLQERMLLEEFLRVSRRTSSAVVSLNRDVLITNTAAATLLDANDHALLWEWASSAATGRVEFVEEVKLNGGLVAQARGRAVGEGRNGPAGVIVELRGGNAGPKRDRRSEVALDPDLPGRSAVWRATLADMAAASQSDRDVLIVGEAGTGKSKVATRVAGDDAVVFEGPLAVVEQDWAMRVSRALDSSEAVVIRHLEAMPPSHVAILSALLGGEHRARLVATADTSAIGDHAARLLDRFEVRLELPALRDRPDDLADIAAGLLRAEAGAGWSRIQPAALTALRAQAWPGNIREFKAVLSTAHQRARGGDIGVAHLPSEYGRPAGKPLPSLQRSERDAIVAALSSARGNKVAAAETLGIARSTLYRKMRAFGLDG